ncbi:LPP20 family lipoprotein, partial [Francisella tularensis subsp. holarctica]|uniref:LPP20 family lipoprotein n=1 Tax=Francisella tularensis TaxID=263 RepID=UPI002381A1E5
SSGQPNTDLFLYGFGAAKRLEKATQKALADMVQKLQVKVSTSTNFTNFRTNEKVYQNLTQQLTTTTTHITIPNYLVIN